MRSAKELVGDNPMIQSLITKEIIGMLAPETEIPEYQEAYIKTVQDPDLRNLMMDTDEQVLSRDLEPSMIPDHEMYGEEDDLTGKQQAEQDNATGEADNTSLLGGAGTPVTNVGLTYYTQQVAPVLLNTMSIGR
jgi:hypothetical protein